MLALIVKLDIHPGHRGRFMVAADAIRTACLQDEPGCLHFDIAEDVEQANRFFFYEIYRDADALAFHRTTPHFLDWRAAAATVVVPGSQVNSVANLLNT